MLLIVMVVLSVALGLAGSRAVLSAVLFVITRGIHRDPFGTVTLRDQFAPVPRSSPT